MDGNLKGVQGQSLICFPITPLRRQTQKALLARINTLRHQWVKSVCSEKLEAPTRQFCFFHPETSLTVDQFEGEKCVSENSFSRSVVLTRVVTERHRCGWSRTSAEINTTHQRLDAVTGSDDCTGLREDHVSQLLPPTQRRTVEKTSRWSWNVKGESVFLLVEKSFLQSPDPTRPQCSTTMTDGRTRFSPKNNGLLTSGVWWVGMTITFPPSACSYLGLH